MDRSALASFLRVRREALRPNDVGLSPGIRRRVAGLRREEVAHLASMSVDYYSRLERGQGAQPSQQMLTVLARVLHLSLDERDYLYRLAGHHAPDRASGDAHVAPRLQRILNRLADTPALVLSDLAETLSQNHLAAALFGDVAGLRGLERSGVARWFLQSEHERRVYREQDRNRQGRALVAALRATVGRRGPASPAAELAEELRRRSEEFSRLWDLQEVGTRYEDHKVLVHPELGPIELDCQALSTEDQSQTLLVFTAAPRSAAEEQLALLSVLGRARFAAAPGDDGGFMAR
ncbi:helix-turn-helix domain-containing protein [Bogoriella caseilytica]|uniref:Helix-turn-helix protein n=1 Tax=Bogoriella caseilytica TaxID=56055 RepID=A0A3N2BB72_9MICO|nr:helix-turn-helix domain-containing protein [Bogoriella caseilytica]ROR72506.1 helix-turn-helix protein [Bogoriella caseilytica]